MGEVIKFNATKDEDNRGYILDHDNPKAKITGVYVENILAMVDHGNVYLGTKADGGVDDALLTNMKDMNEFCLMWLLIFNESVIVNESDQGVDNGK